jgi:hypothetical protein
MNKVIVALVTLAATAISHAQPNSTLSNSGAVIVSTNTVTVTNVSNQPVTNFFTLADLLTALTNLQTAAEAALPPLASFNDTFTFISIVTPSSAVILNAASSTNGNFGISTGLGGAALTQPAGGFTVTRDTLRRLLLLQNEIEETLVLLNLVTAPTNAPVTNTVTIGVVPGALQGNFTGQFGTFTNVFVTPLTNGFIAPLTGPTGLGTTNAGF